MHKKKKIDLSQCLINDSETVREGIGRNIIPPPQKEPLWKLYIEKFKDPIIIVLLIVFSLSILLSIYEVFYLGKDFSLLFEPIGIFIALMLATGVGFIFEVKAAKEFETLNKVKDRRPVKVYRKKKANGKPVLMIIKKHDVVCKRISEEEVIGDIIKLESGDEVPADGILLEATSLRVDESNFTGEPYACKTTEAEEFDHEATYPSNFLLRGSTIIEGSAIYKATHIGIDTEEGKGVATSREGSDVETPLNSQLSQLSKWISITSFILAALIVVGRMIYFFFLDGEAGGNHSLIEILDYTLSSIMIAVTLIVVAVPEGLPMSVTVSLAISMRKMLKENNLVRKLHACETMGATTVICTDKTGTLTKNQMTVLETDFYGGVREYEIVRENIAINSTAEVYKDNDGKVSIIGNPTEGALLKWVYKSGIEYEAYRNNASIIKQVPFSTDIKYMETTATINDANTAIRYIKGAPEIVLSMCSSIAGGVSEEHILQKLQEYQNKAMRTLAFAYQQIDGNEVRETIFLGIVGIADPIRKDVKEAIRVCREDAGVRVIIVTGDTPGTANEIGRQIGILEEGEENHTITGPEFSQMLDEGREEELLSRGIKIISRARPNDKARLVTLLQKQGEVVAVTGDGTNDAPALSKAQVGLSMGDGTSRAKEASDITIIDNSFSSINKAIMWGRSLYINIRRFIIFQMTINVCACLIVVLGSFIGLDSPLNVTQMLWVNLIMDTFAAMALSSLPADKRVLHDKPRDPNSHIINRNMLYKILGNGFIFFIFLAGLWQLMWHKDISSVKELLSPDSIELFFTGFFSMEKINPHIKSIELGIFFSIFVALQFWNLFNTKYFHTNRSFIQDIGLLFTNPAKLKESYSLGFAGIVITILLGQILIVNCAGSIFGVEALTLSDWGYILLITSPVLVIGDIIRFIKNILANKKAALHQ